MSEQKNNIKSIYKYFEFIKEVMRIATDCWASGEGHFEGKVVNDKGHRAGWVDGSPRKRFSEKDEDEE